MNMLAIVLGNLFRAARSRLPTDASPVPATFRGALTHDARRCTGCGTCAFVCAPKAIRFEEDPGKSITWQFTIGRCSFCGLCQQNCPTQAIGNASAMPATMNNAAGDGLRLESVVPFMACPRCRKPFIPFPGAASPLCPECRQWATSAGLRRAFLADEAANDGR